MIQIGFFDTPIDTPIDKQDIRADLLALADGIEAGNLLAVEVINLACETSEKHAAFNAAIVHFLLSVLIHKRVHHEDHQLANLSNDICFQSPLNQANGSAQIEQKSKDLLAEPLSSAHLQSLSDQMTVAGNHAGIPAVSIPAGLDPLGLPIGVQFFGMDFREDLILRAAYAFEQATQNADWRGVIPQVLRGSEVSA